MKILSETCQKITPHTVAFIHVSTAILAAMLTLAAVCGIVADSTAHYYELIALKADLLSALRSCTAILGGGAIALQWAETTGKKLI